MSLPARGAWIEISNPQRPSHTSGSLPARGAWIEITQQTINMPPSKSLPARGAWIEIMAVSAVPFPPIVAPREGSVD